MAISAVVLTHNSEKTIQKCLDSLSWCDEILVIDDDSTDKTRELAQKSKVYQHKLNGNWAEQRNFALTKVKTEWVLYVDSDEIVSDLMRVNIQDHLQADNTDGYFLKRQDKFLGKVLKHGETANVRLLRLAKRDSGKWRRAVHEYWDISGTLGIIETPLIHDRDFNLTDFIDRLNKYTDIDAKELVNEGKAFKRLELLKPVGKFLDSYLFKLGFLDGFSGFVFAFLMSLHSLVVRIKTWELRKKS